MGLRAVVYTNSKNLDFEISSGFLEVDSETGEIFVSEKNSSHFPLPEEKTIAISYRVGNIDTVNFLKQKISNLIRDFSFSIIIEKILYSGTHSGDKLDISELDDLKKEIIYLKRILNSKDSSLEDFTENMLNLIKVAKKEENPIVFL